METPVDLSIAPFTARSPFASKMAAESLPSNISADPFGAVEGLEVVKSRSENTQHSQDIILGQVSYTPAIQTTVVTTTTTTTTKFPPLVMKAPQYLNDLDPKLYPLAGTPTPASIRNFHFNLGDRSAFFQEAQDTAKTLEEVSTQCGWGVHVNEKH